MLDYPVGRTLPEAVDTGAVVDQGEEEVEQDGQDYRHPVDNGLKKNWNKGEKIKTREQRKVACLNVNKIL